MFRKIILMSYGFFLLTKPVYGESVEEKYEGYLNVIQNKDINQSIECAIRLIEKQFGGDASPLDGFFFLDQLLDHVDSYEKDLKGLRESCELVLSKYKKDTKKGVTHSYYLSPEAETLYLKKITEQFKNRPEFEVIAKKGINSFAKCQTKFGFQLFGGVGLGFGLAFDRYSCTTPLGLKYSIYAPSLAGGLGLGGSLELLDYRKKQDFYFLIPRYLKVNLLSDISSGATFFWGKGISWSLSSLDRSNIKDFRLGLGLSTYLMQRKLYLIKKRERSTFSEVVRILNLD